MSQQLFNLGKIVSTPGALCLLDETGTKALSLLSRHITGDWGELSEDDKRANTDALKDGSRIVSSYLLKDGSKVWVITEAVGDDGERASTTFLLPEEY